MTQPELGKRLTEFKNEAGLTQKQLSEKSKINIRTIQRIESGEVSPRTYTIKLLLDALGKSYDEVNGNPKISGVFKPEVYKKAWISAIGMAICNILFITIVIFRDMYGVRSGIYHLNVPVLLSTIILTIFLNKGIIHLGRSFENKFLVLTGIIGIVLIFICNFSQVARFYVFEHWVSLLAKTVLILMSINGIFYGVGMVLLKEKLNDLALITGVLIIFTSVLYIVPNGLVELFVVVIINCKFIVTSAYFL